MSKNLPFSTQHNQFTNSTRPSIILRKVIIILRIDWVTNLIDSLFLVSITVFWKIDCTDFFGCTIITPYLILRWAIIIPKIVQLNHFFCCVWYLPNVSFDPIFLQVYNSYEEDLWVSNICKTGKILTQQRLL